MAISAGWLEPIYFKKCYWIMAKNWIRFLQTRQIQNQIIWHTVGLCELCKCSSRIKKRETDLGWVPGQLKPLPVILWTPQKPNSTWTTVCLIRPVKSKAFSQLFLFLHSFIPSFWTLWAKKFRHRLIWLDDLLSISQSYFASIFCGITYFGSKSLICHLSFSIFQYFCLFLAPLEAFLPLQTLTLDL